MSTLTPTDGVRLLLEIGSESGTSAMYKGSIHTPDDVFKYEVALKDSGEAILIPLAASAEPVLETKLSNIAKSVARAAERKRNDGLKPWPHRVLRWRR